MTDSFYIFFYYSQAYVRLERTETNLMHFKWELT